MKKQAVTINSIIELFIGANVIVYTTEIETREIEDGEVAEGKLAYAGHLLGADDRFLLLGNIKEDGDAEPVVAINLDSVVSIREYGPSEARDDLAGPVFNDEVN